MTASSPDDSQRLTPPLDCTQTAPRMHCGLDREILDTQSLTHPPPPFISFHSTSLQAYIKMMSEQQRIQKSFFVINRFIHDGIPITTYSGRSLLVCNTSSAYGIKMSVALLILHVMTYYMKEQARICKLNYRKVSQVGIIRTCRNITAAAGGKHKQQQCKALEHNLFLFFRAVFVTDPLAVNIENCLAEFLQQGKFPQVIGTRIGTLLDICNRGIGGGVIVLIMEINSLSLEQLIAALPLHHREEKFLRSEGGLPVPVVRFGDMFTRYLAHFYASDVYFWFFTPNHLPGKSAVSCTHNLFQQVT